jgi:two-component system, CitB family, sensor kinase
VRRRLSLTGQLLVLQLAIVVVVVAGVVLVTLAREAARFRDIESRRALAVAENVAAADTIRAGVEGGSLTALRIAAEGARATSGSTYVIVTDDSGKVLASPFPDQLDNVADLGSSPALQDGRAWIGTVNGPGGRAVEAQVPVMSEGGTSGTSVGDVIGVVVVGRSYPTAAQTFALVTPNLLTYLGVAGLVGALGSLFIARRVRKQTLGLDPQEIVGLVEHREAMLHGIREGVLALDLRRRVTLVNDEARTLLNLPDDAVGRVLDDMALDSDVVTALTRMSVQPDQVLPVGGRLLIINSLPIVNRGQRLGSVTTLRDRTELMALQRSLDVTQHATDTLRAQAHEFSNRLHTISGLIELEAYDEVVQYVQRLDAGDSQFTSDVVERISDPAVAALLVAKAAQAHERGVELLVTPTSRLPPVDEAMSTDVVTVVGNLVDNAFDVLADVADLDGAGARSRVSVEIAQVDQAVQVTVSDTGPGIDPSSIDELFRRGFSTKPAGGPAGERGIGLSLVRLVCRRRGGQVTAHNDNGAVFVATLPMAVRVPS